MINSDALAESEAIQTEEEIVVIGVTPTHGVNLPIELIPYSVQSATSEDLDSAQSFDLSDFMNRNLGSISINEAQNNPLQPDVQYRGFTASPLLGLPQGIAVYQNGVRINEPFGDTINWDLIPESAISSINLIGGSNPLFGLNTLGGALSITTKNGFTHPDHGAEAYGGSFERIVTSIESGNNNGNWGYFFTGSYFEEDGWRDDSESDALNAFGTLSWRNDVSTLDLSLSHGDTELRGNGPLPIQLLEIDRDTIFTSPDITENNMVMLNLEGSHWLKDTILLSGNVFYRTNDADSFNGDGTEFVECTSDPGFLCEEDDLTDPIEDQNGNMIPAGNDAINNISRREQEGFGATLQTTFINDLFEHQNQAIIGTSYSQGLADFDSQVEIAFHNPDRSTTGTGLFVPDESTVIKTHTRSWAIYFTDTFSITETLALTLSGRYNNTHVVIGDRNSINPSPELNGEHDYQRFNPAAGFTWQFNPEISMYASYSESSRAPTPIELACADPDAPCNLPNAFLADPPLDQVVSESWETGLRGSFGASTIWNLGVFRTENKDDIIFISTGGVSANEGFFDNIGETERLGLEAGINGIWNDLDWFLNYSFVNATFETDFLVSSPNHPFAIDTDGDTVGDSIQVRDGDRIPGIPQHNFKIGGDYAMTPKFSIGGDLVYNSNQYLRGDEANLLDTIDGYAVVNIRGSYQYNQYVSFFARINNLLDSDYETFGLLGDPEEVLGPAFDDPRFLAPGAPISGFIGITISI
ncbi:MAG: TonB-dependent receptor [Gammaproteobacteria bacterium]|nr:TonB-dependent receptor [Gammaproteobacteria bacterium]